MRETIGRLRESIEMSCFSHYNEYLIKEVITGAERYEKLRKLNVKEFGDLFQRCLYRDANFDREVDQL